MTEALRSGLLAAWANAWLAGRTSYDEVLEHVTAGDEPHRVRRLPDTEGDVPLGWALAAIREKRPDELRLVLPVPGDPRGLPGVSDFSAAALRAGEGVIAGPLGLVPLVTRHGSTVGSVTTTVRWDVFAVPPPSPDPLTVPEAESALAEALRSVTAELARLDVARWRPELAGALEALRRPPSEVGLPPGYAARAHRLLAQADRLGQVLALAGSDAPGGAVNAQEASGRAEALRTLESAVRRARLAAYNGVC